jgi:hypothetical protein
MQPLDDRLIPRLLWFLQGLFLARVIGQILVQFWGVEFLPPSPEWYSGVVDYPPLLLFQLTILGLQTWVNVNFTQRAGFFAGRSRRFGKALVVFGAIYLLVMVTRYALRMTLYPLERWSGGSIPIFFHWVLASLHRVGSAHNLSSEPPAYLAFCHPVASTSCRHWVGNITCFDRLLPRLGVLSRGTRISRLEDHRACSALRGSNRSRAISRD